MDVHHESEHIVTVGNKDKNKAVWMNKEMMEKELGSKKAAKLIESGKLEKQADSTAGHVCLEKKRIATSPRKLHIKTHHPAIPRA